MLEHIRQSNKYNQLLEMIYVDGKGTITKRRIKVLKMNKDTFVAYCFLRRANRTFKNSHVLALVPIERYSKIVC